MALIEIALINANINNELSLKNTIFSALKVAQL